MVQFSVALSYYGRSAYNFLRKEFGSSLPSLSSIQNWSSQIDARPGITRESIEIAKEFIKTNKKQTYFCLTMDEMAIKQGIEYHHGQTHGYADFINSNDEPKIAKNALVFMITAINGYFKIPVAYFFVTGTAAEQKASFISILISILYANGIDIRCMTFDGLQVGFLSSLSMLSILNLSISSFLSMSNSQWKHCDFNNIEFSFK